MSVSGKDFTLPKNFVQSFFGSEHKKTIVKNMLTVIS